MDVQIWRAEFPFAIGESRLGGENPAIFVRAEDEFVWSNGERFDFLEDSKLAEDMGGVRRYLDACSNLGWELGGGTGDFGGEETYLAEFRRLL
jgi:hypothetical protein